MFRNRRAAGTQDALSCSSEGGDLQIAEGSRDSSHRTSVSGLAGSVESRSRVRAPVFETTDRPLRPASLERPGNTQNRMYGFPSILRRRLATALPIIISNCRSRAGAIRGFQDTGPSSHWPALGDVSVDVTISAAGVLVFAPAAPAAPACRSACTVVTNPNAPPPGRDPDRAARWHQRVIPQRFDIAGPLTVPLARRLPL